MEHTAEHDMIIAYVHWIMAQSMKKGFTTIYFLARDGYLLHRLAEKFCQQHRIPIVCKYLYCSRAALRMPTYHFIGQEGYDLLFQKGYRTTLQDIFDRAQLTPMEQKQLRKEVQELSTFTENHILEIKELEHLRRILSENFFFKSCLCRTSRAAWEDAVGYFRQEGLFDQQTVVLVDSGWTGSMQRSMRQLLTSAGFQGNLYGFYFGLYSTPRDKADGIYDSFYFSPGDQLRRKILFANNVVECMLSAPHGMTVGYRRTDVGYEPVRLPPPQPAVQKKINQGIETCLNRADAMWAAKQQKDGQRGYLTLSCVKEFQRVMVQPTQTECAYYGAFLFCDDVTEGYALPLASEQQCRVLENYLLHRRILSKLRKKTLCDSAELFWVYGVIAFLPNWKQWWYRWNIYVWEWLRLMGKRG